MEVLGRMEMRRQESFPRASVREARVSLARHGQSKLKA